jgi:hypothetical protein
VLRRLEHLSLRSASAQSSKHTLRVYAMSDQQHGVPRYGIGGGPAVNGNYQDVAAAASRPLVRVRPIGWDQHSFD